MRRLSDRTPELAIVAVLAVLVVVGIAAGTGGSSGEASSSSPSGATYDRARVGLIAARVEELRGLRFRRPVAVEVVSPAEARRIGLREMTRTQPVAERRADDELLKLLGLLPAGIDSRRIASLIYAEQVAGFYDPRSRRLALVRGAGVDDVTLSHELTHALEDQHFDLEHVGTGPDEDRATAEQALVEGTATLVMTEYAQRWPTETPVGDALSGLTQVTGSTPLPAYTIRSMVFPYIQGERFAEALRTAGGGWQLVDVALRARPPVTSAEILDPDRWLRAERAAPVALGGAAALRAGGWRRLAGSTLGAEDLAALLTADSSALEARRLTAGWTGGRYAFWRRGPLPAPGCAAPCRGRDVVQLAVRTRTRRQADELLHALAGWIDSLPDASAGSVRTDDDGRTVRAVLAPTVALADTLTR